MSGEVQMVKCPVCGSSGMPGDFCEMGCGRLPAPPSSPQPGAKTERAPEGVVDAGKIPVGKPHGPAGAPTAPSLPSVQPPPPPPSPPPPRPSGAGGDAGGFSAAAPQRPAGAVAGTGELELERDALCVFFEGVTGVLRFRITAGRKLEAVSIGMENPLTGAKVKSRRVGFLEAGAKREIGVSVPGQEAGAVGWYLTVEYEVDGRKRFLEGEATVLSLKPREAQMAAKNLSVTINNNITNGNASDVTLSQHAAEDLEHLAHAENPYEELRKIVQGNQRAWTQTSLDRGGTLEALPPLPAGAATDRLVLELGTGRLHLRVGRSLTIGRSPAPGGIPLRSSKRMGPEETELFLRISRRHCQFEPAGENVLLTDGYRDGMRGVQPSKWGTYWEGAAIDGSKELAPGEEGVLSFAGLVPVEDGKSFRVKVCRPCGGCGNCTRTDRGWCGNGHHPCLLLTRRGGIPEAYVALWGCFALGEIDPAFEGVTLFRERGGFAWRRGRRSGWLVPGTVLGTEAGTVRVLGEEQTV